MRAICDNRESHVQEYAKTWNIPNVFTDWKDILELDSINTIYIATPTVSHKDIFIAAADAGKHIFVQKPLAFTIEDIQEKWSLCASRTYSTLAPRILDNPKDLYGSKLQEEDGTIIQHSL